MTLESLLRLVHLVAAMAWVGGALVLSVVATRIRGRGDADEIREFAATLSHVGLRVLAPSVIALFAADRRPGSVYTRLSLSFVVCSGR